MAPYFDSFGNWCSIWELCFTSSSCMSSNPYSRKSIWLFVGLCLLSPKWVPFIGNLASIIIVYTILRTSWWNFLNVSVMTCFCLNRISFGHYDFSGDGTYLQSHCQGVPLVWEAYVISWEAFLNWFGCCMNSGFNAEWQLIYHFDWGRLLGASTCINGVLPIPLHGLVRAGIIISLSKEVFPQHLPTWWKFIVGNWLNTYMVVS